MTAPARPLVHARVDGWLLGGAGLLAWVVLSTAMRGSGVAISGLVLWGFAILTAMHFGASYHLAYAGGRRSLREHPVSLVIVPAAIVVAAGAVALFVPMASGHTSRSMLRVLLVMVFTLTGWHYIKQAFGVAILSVRSRRLPLSKFDVLALRYGLYPIWLFQVLHIYGHDTHASYRSLSISEAVVPAAGEQIVRALAIAGAVAAAGVIVRLAVRQRFVPPAGLWATYAAAFLWFVFPPSYVSAGIVLSGIHGLQYLPIAHRAEVDRAREHGEQNLVHWWLCVFGGAAAAGLLLVTFLPGLLDRHAVVATVPGLYGSLIFVALNLHHYAIDATIWRSDGEHIRRISRGPAVAPAESESSSELAPTAPAPSFA